MQSMTHNILRIDASMRQQGSVTRELADLVIAQLEGRVDNRDLAAESLPFVDQSWIGANFTPEQERRDEQRAALAQSDALSGELQKADTIVIALPIYNFSMPAAFKAWIDLIARARVTFKYTDQGPVGLLTGKKAYIVNASGGVPIGSPADFLSGYVRHVLKFVGITDVDFLDGSKLKEGAKLADAVLADV